MPQTSKFALDPACLCTIKPIHKKYMDKSAIPQPQAVGIGIVAQFE